jgi:hypothetical protein
MGCRAMKRSVICNVLCEELRALIYPRCGNIRARRFREAITVAWTVEDLASSLAPGSSLRRERHADRLVRYGAEDRLTLPTPGFLRAKSQIIAEQGQVVFLELLAWQ